jgi:hypothetical protein
MWHAAARVGLVPVLGAFMLLGGCTTLESDGYWVSDYPSYRRDVYVYEQRYRNPDGLIVTYDSGPSLYSVVRYPGIYWHDGYYYRQHRGHWERSRYHRGPWRVHHHAPPRVVVPRDAPRDRPKRHPIAVPDRRPVYDWPDRYRKARPPRPMPKPGPVLEPGRERVKGFPGPQNIPYVRGPDQARVSPPPVVPAQPQRVLRHRQASPPPGAVSDPRRRVMDRMPDGSRWGTVPQDRGRSDRPGSRLPVPGGSAPVSREGGDGGSRVPPPWVRGPGADGLPRQEGVQRQARRTADVPMIVPGVRRQTPREEGDSASDPREPNAVGPSWNPTRRF